MFVYSVFLVLSLAVFSSVFSASANVEPLIDGMIDSHGMEYVCVIDAGSTGSRIYIYSYNSEDPFHTLTAVSHKRVRPALSSFVMDTTGLRKQLDELLDLAVKYIPSEQWSSTPISLKATAGLRRLSLSAQNSLLSVVRSHLDSSPFMHETSTATAATESSVISGKAEAVFDILAVTTAFQSIYDDENNNNNNNNNNIKEDGNDEKNEKILLGVADLGGSSTQYAFHLKDGDSVVDAYKDWGSVDSNGAIIGPFGDESHACGQLNVGGNDDDHDTDAVSATSSSAAAAAVYGMCARSVPGLGLVEGMESLMRRFEREMLLVCKERSKIMEMGSHLENRCTYEDVDTFVGASASGHALWGPSESDLETALPSWAHENDNPCLAKDGVPLFSSITGKEHTVKGAGDFQKCVQLIQEYIIPKAVDVFGDITCDSHNNIEQNPKEVVPVKVSRICQKSMNGTNHHHRRPHYVIGLDNFPKVLEMIGFNNTLDKRMEAMNAIHRLALSPATIANAGITACKKKWSDLLLNFPNEPAYRAQRACYGSAFIYVMIKDIYGIPEYSNEFVPIEEFEPYGELGWALGAAMALAVGAT
jgi:hypothetical protein